MAACVSPHCTLYTNISCEPHKHSDTSQPECSSVCITLMEEYSPPAAGGHHRRRLLQEGSDPCRWCKCKACAFCVGTDSLFAHGVVEPADHLVVLATSTAEAARKAVDGWLQWAPRPFVVIDKSGVPNVGMEASTYLWFLLRHYSRLPRWLCFMHLHEYDWHHPKYSQLRSMAIDVDRAGAPFLSLAHDRDGRFVMFEKQPVKELSDNEHNSLRKELLGYDIPLPDDSSGMSYTRYPPGAQFWVSRERVLARPRSHYLQLYATMIDEHHPLLGRTSWTEMYRGRQIGAFFMEAYWHIWFGEGGAAELRYKNYDELPFINVPVDGGHELHGGYTCDSPHSWRHPTWANCTTSYMTASQIDRILDTSARQRPPRTPPPPSPHPPPPPTPRPPPGLCDDGCTLARNGVCDDGGPGAYYADCPFGTDCGDCGERAASRASDSGRDL